MNRLNAYITNSYVDKETGEEKTNYALIGAAMPHKKGNGITVYINPGIALRKNEIVLYPVKKKAADASSKGAQDQDSPVDRDDDIPF